MSTQANDILERWTPLSNKRLQDLDEHSWQRVRGLILRSINLLFEYEKTMIGVKRSIDEHLTPNELEEQAHQKSQKPSLDKELKPLQQ